MFLCIADILDRNDLEAVVGRLNATTFDDGSATAGWHARLVKRNLQARRDEPSLEELRARLAARILGNPVFQLAARPKALTPLLLSRYEPGMSYGTHVDDALMGGLRTDLAFTLFLSDPDSYAGGELVIEAPGGEESFKLAAGSLLLYPATTLHRVEPVTAGHRLAAVGWVRSHIRDASRRELLFDLDTARRALFECHGKTAEFDLLSKCSANLLRMWAED
ncbi:Fe2+-dependent dioxygenase [Benzoatithermus flavus]|uniref:Fe2+-dependent dioxygenase n=1 Tax=Benzoatithermus flavus TaxID=3108223 RepID=A0ABU8XW43_9PROT